MIQQVNQNTNSVPQDQQTVKMTPQQVKDNMHADSNVNNINQTKSETNKVNNVNQNNNVKNNQAANQVADQYNQTYQNEKQQYQAAQTGKPAPVSGGQSSSMSQSTVVKPQTKTVSQVNAQSNQNSSTSNAANVTRAAATNSNNLPVSNQVKAGTTNNLDKQVTSNNVSNTSSTPFHHYDDLTDTSFTTDKAVYNPGDTVHTSITLKNTANFNQWGTYKLNVFNPTTQVMTVASGNWKADQGQSQTLNLDWTTPKIDDQGYVMDLQLFTSTGNLLDEFTNAVDVDTDPYKHPRYGALTDFSGGNIAKEKAMVDSLAKNYHLNMQMLYDCYFEPQDPLPNEAQWKNWHGDEISKQAIQDIVNQIHQDGGKAFLYDMIGATSDKSMPQTGFYDPNTGDWLNANLGNGNYQYYHNIANADWQKFIIPVVIKQAQTMGFDGWQGDTPGNLNGNSYDQRKDKARAFNDSDFYHYFASAVMNYIKQNDPKFAFGMNSVNAAGQTAIAKDSGDTFDYSELWPDAYPTYGDIANVIEQNWQNDGKPLVVPAYLYNQWRDAETNGQSHDLPKTYNGNAVRQLIATIMANGGSPMVLADGGYLIDDQYYPWMRMENGKQINMSPVLGDPTNGEMKHYFDFDTGYENLLQDPTMKSNNNYIQVWNGGSVNQGQCINKNDAEANTVYAFSKSNGTIDTLNLVNLMGSTNKWQVYNTSDNNSHNVQEQKNLWIKYYPSEQGQNIKHIYVSSPDSYYKGKRIEVPFKEMVDPSGNKYVEFEVPDLQIWDLVYMTTQDPQNTITNKPSQGSQPVTKPATPSDSSQGKPSGTSGAIPNKPSDSTPTTKPATPNSSSSGSSTSKPSSTTGSKPADTDKGSSSSSKPAQGSSTNKPSTNGSSSSTGSSTPSSEPSQGSQPATKPTTPSDSSQSKPSGTSNAIPNKPSGSTSSGSTAAPNNKPAGTTNKPQDGSQGGSNSTTPNNPSSSTSSGSTKPVGSQGEPTNKPQGGSQGSSQSGSNSTTSATPAKPSTSGSAQGNNQPDQGSLSPIKPQDSSQGSSQGESTPTSGSQSGSTSATPSKPSDSTSSGDMTNTGKPVGTPDQSQSSSQNGAHDETHDETHDVSPVSGNTKPTMSSTSTSSSTTPTSSTSDQTNSVGKSSTQVSSQSMTTPKTTGTAQGSAITSDNVVKPLTPNVTAPRGISASTTSDGSPVSVLDVSPQSSRQSGASSADHSEQNSINGPASGLENNFDVQSHTNPDESHSTDLVAGGTPVSLAQTGESTNTSWLASLLSALGLGALLKRKCD